MFLLTKADIFADGYDEHESLNRVYVSRLR